MVAVVSTWTLRLPEARSLKDRRAVVRSLRDRLQKLNLSVADVGDQDRWGHVELAVALVATDRAFADSVLAKADALVEREHRAVIVGSDRFEA